MKTLITRIKRLALALCLATPFVSRAAMEFTDPTYTPWDGVYGAAAWRGDGGNFEVSKVADIAADGTIGEPYAMKWDTAVATSGRRFCSACTSSSSYPGYTPPGMLLVYDQTGKADAANATFNPLSFCGLWVKALADETTPYSVTGSSSNNRATEFGVAGVSSYFKFDKSFTVNRTGTTTFYGEATVDIAQDATFTAQANASYGVAVDSAATLKLKGAGTLAVTTMTVNGTLDLSAETVPTISGNVTLAGTIVLPGGTEVTQVSPFTVCSGTLSGVNVFVKIGDAEAVEKSFTAENGAITSFGEPIYIFTENYPTVVPAGKTYTFVGGDTAENTVVVDALDVYGTLKTQGYFSFTNYKSNGSTLDVESGSLTLNPGGNWFNGTLTVEAGATFVNTLTDAVQYGGSFTANIYGTLDMGATRWSLGSNNTLNFYEGCTVTGSGDGGNGTFDWIENANATMNVYGGVTLDAPIKIRGGATVNMNVDAGANAGLTLAGTIGSGTIVKKGAGLIQFTTNPPYAITVENGAFTFAVDATPTITYSAKPGTGTTMSMWYATQDTWKGTVVLGVLDAPAALLLNSYGNVNSKVVMKGTTGSCYLSSGTINPELVIDTDEDNVVEFNNGSSGQVVNFTKISGAGTLKLTGWTGCSGATYVVNTFDNFTGTLAIYNAITRNGGGTFTIGIGNIVTTGSTTPGSKVLKLTQTAVSGATGTVVYNTANAQVNGEDAKLVVAANGVYVPVASTTIGGVTAYYNDIMSAFNAVSAGSAGDTLTVLDGNEYGDVDGFSYNSETKTYTMLQMVAQIVKGVSTYKYTTLAGAVGAATNGDTVELLTDVTLEARVDVNVGAGTTITIDLGENTITTSATCLNGSAFNIQSGTVTITNGSVIGVEGPRGEEAYECDVITVRSGAEVVVSAMTITIDSRNGACVYPFTGAKATILSGTYANTTVKVYEYGRFKAAELKGMAVNQGNTADQLLFIEGGSFKQIDPTLGDDSWAEGAGTFLASGYVATWNPSTGYYDVSVKSSGEAVVPGGESETTYDNEDDAKAAAESTEVAVTTEVSAALAANEVSESDYKALFQAKAVEKTDGSWAVEVVLADGVQTEVDTAVADAEESIVDDVINGDETTVTVETKPGLYYSLSEGATLEGMTEGTRVMGTGAALEFTPNKYTGSGFYSINVNAVP